MLSEVRESQTKKFSDIMKAVITDKDYQFEFESKCPINDIEEVSPDVFTYTLINLKTTLPENNEQIILKYRKICMEKVTQLQKKKFLEIKKKIGIFWGKNRGKFSKKSRFPPKI